MNRIVFIVGLLGLMLIPGTIFGQANKRQAKQLYDQGSAHYSAGRYQQAIDAFTQANQLSPHPVLVKNVAKAYERMQDLPKAIEFYQEYLSTQPKDAGKIRPKVARLNATLATWPSLKLSSNPPGATIRIGSAQSRVYGRTPTTLRLAPKRHVILLDKPGFKSVSRPVLFEPGSHRSMNIVLSSTAGPAPVAAVAPAAVAPAAVAPVAVPPVAVVPVPQVPQVVSSPPVIPVPPPSATPAPVTAPPVTSVPQVVSVPQVTSTSPTPASAGGASAAVNVEGGSSMKLWGWVGMGTGAALVVGGTITGIMAVGTKSDLDACQADPNCQRTDREGQLAGDVQSQALTTDVLIGTGVIIAGGGALVYFLLGESAGSEQVSWSISPTVGGAAAQSIFRF